MTGDVAFAGGLHVDGMVIGNVTAQYPLIFEVDPLRDVNTAGETRYFFRE